MNKRRKLLVALGTGLLVDSSKKRPELLKESVPSISSIAVLWNPRNPGNTLALKETEAAASGRAQALLPLPDPLMTTHAKRIVDFAATNRPPANQFVHRPCRE